MSPATSAIKRHWRLLVFVTTLVTVLVVLWILKNIFLPFIVGLILVVLILPVIRWLDERIPSKGKNPRFHEYKRIAIILVAFFFALVIVGLGLFYTITLVDRALTTLTSQSADFTTSGLANIRAFLIKLPVLSNPIVIASLDRYLEEANTALPNVLNSFLENSIKNIGSSVNIILGFLIMPFFMFFVIKDWDRLRDKFYSNLPQWMAVHTQKVLAILQKVIIHYFRGQLFLGLVVGTCAGILLLALGIQFALPLAVFAGLTELVPMIGPWLGGGLAVVITLATAPERIIFVIIGFLAIQLLENNLLVPRIQGSQMNIHPAFVIILSLIGAYFAGILGFIIILPATMAVINIYTYLRSATLNGTLN